MEEPVARVYRNSDLNCKTIVMTAQWNIFEWGYRRRSAKEGVAEKLAEVKRVVESVRRELLH